MTLIGERPVARLIVLIALLMVNVTVVLLGQERVAPASFWVVFAPQIAPTLVAVATLMTVLFTYLKSSKEQSAHATRTDTKIEMSHADTAGKLNEIGISTNGNVTKMMARIDQLERILIARGEALPLAPPKGPSETAQQMRSSSRIHELEQQLAAAKLAEAEPPPGLL